MATYKIAILDGDGIGPEIMKEAIKVLDLVGERNDVDFALEHGAFGAQAYFDHGHAFPEATKTLCDDADAILKGPIGLSHEESKKIPVDMQPERGALLPLRRRYNTYANFLAKAINENHNTRAAVISAQLFKCGYGVERKFSTSTSSFETYFAARLGGQFDSAGTARLSVK